MSKKIDYIIFCVFNFIKIRFMQLTENFFPRFHANEDVRFRRGSYRLNLLYRPIHQLTEISCERRGSCEQRASISQRKLPFKLTLPAHSSINLSEKWFHANEDVRFRIGSYRLCSFRTIRDVDSGFSFAVHGQMFLLKSGDSFRSEISKSNLSLY